MPSDSTYSLGMIANGDAYTSVKQDGSGHIRVSVSPTGVKVDYVRAYLPADTITGLHKNAEVTYSYTVGNFITGINDLPVNDLSVKIYPNPARGLLHVAMPDNIQQFETEVCDITGKKWIRSRSKVIDVTKLPAGIYMVRVSTAQKVIVRKISIIN